MILQTLQYIFMIHCFQFKSIKITKRLIFHENVTAGMQNEIGWLPARTSSCAQIFPRLSFGGRALHLWMQLREPIVHH